MLVLATLLALIAGMHPAADFRQVDSTPPTTTLLTSSIVEGVRVSSVTFTFRGKPVRALLVEPKRAIESAPGVLFAHWLGDPQTTNRTEFRADAIWLAKRGIVSLLPDEPWAAPNWFEVVRSTTTDAPDSLAAVARLQRSLDVLVATGEVDPARLAFVGHDFGAMYGALFVAVDTRPRAVVFMTPTVTFREWFLLDTRRPPVDRIAYEQTMRAFDVPPYLAKARFRASLIQFARHDEYVSAAKAAIFANAVPNRSRTIRTYDAGHSLAIGVATSDRRSWLADQLR